MTESFDGEGDERRGLPKQMITVHFKFCVKKKSIALPLSQDLEMNMRWWTLLPCIMPCVEKHKHHKWWFDKHHAGIASTEKGGSELELQLNPEVACYRRKASLGNKQFNRLSWSKPVAATEEYSLPMIGRWQHHPVESEQVKSEDQNGASVAWLEKHTGLVKSLEFVQSH